MATIATPPRGLISLFGLRDMGAVPNDLASTVAPTIDITEFALTNREAIYTGLVNLTGVGNVSFGSTVTVPAGELWYVHSWTISTSTLAAGQTLDIKPIYWESNFTIFGRGARASGTVNHSIVAFTDRMFLATSGSQLQVYVEQISGGPIGAAGSALITRLRSS